MRDDGVKIVTVLKRGGDFKPEHVERLRDQCKRFASDVPFHCLTDHPSVPNRWLLNDGFPAWWSKMELFRIEGPVLYMDLDTTVVDDLSPLLSAAFDHSFVAIRDFLGYPKTRTIGSGLMAWNGWNGEIYDAFARAPLAHMARCSTSRLWGDQGFIEPFIIDRVKFWQDVTPEAVVSFKKHCRDGVPEGARVVCHHGKPRPWEI